MNTNELYNAPQKLNEDLSNLEINLHDVIEYASSAFVQQTYDKYKSLSLRKEYRMNRKQII